MKTEASKSPNIVRATDNFAGLLLRMGGWEVGEEPRRFTTILAGERRERECVPIIGGELRCPPFNVADYLKMIGVGLDCTLTFQGGEEGALDLARTRPAVVARAAGSTRGIEPGMLRATQAALALSLV